MGMTVNVIALFARYPYFQVGQRVGVGPSTQKSRQSAQLFPMNIVEMPETNLKLGSEKPSRDHNSSLKQSSVPSEWLSQSLNESFQSKISSSTQNADPDSDVITESMQQGIKSTKVPNFGSGFNQVSDQNISRTKNSSLNLLQGKSQASGDSSKVNTENRRPSVVLASRRQGVGIVAEADSRRSSITQQEVKKYPVVSHRDPVRDFMASIGLPTDKVLYSQNQEPSPSSTKSALLRDSLSLTKGSFTNIPPPSNVKSLQYQWNDVTKTDAFGDILG